MYIGIDHSTTGIKTCLLSPDGSSETFVLERSPDNENEWSFEELLAERVDLDDVRMAAIGYSYGDNFGDIRPVEDVDNRGVVDNLGAGHPSGTGSKVFDDLVASDVPCVAFPGVNDNVDCLHRYFKHYDTITGADKVAMTRYAQELLDGEDADTFVAANASSSAMATLVREGKLVGAFHWMGLVHGWAGLGSVRRVQRGDALLSDIFMDSGILRRSGFTFEDVKGKPDPELLEMVYWATLHHVYSLVPFARHVAGDSLDAIVLSGRLSRLDAPIDVRERLRSAFADVAPTHFCPKYSTARGAAYIAKDVYRGESDVLGLPVEGVRRELVA